MIQKLLLNIQMMRMIFMKILKNTIQIKSEKHWSYSIILLLICLVIKKINPIVTELFIRGRKLNIFLVFITQSHFTVPKNIRLNSTHGYENSKQKRTSTSSDIDFQDFMIL